MTFIITQTAFKKESNDVALFFAGLEKVWNVAMAGTRSHAVPMPLAGAAQVIH
jgi:hypothetical protein